MPTVPYTYLPRARLCEAERRLPATCVRRLCNKCTNANVHGYGYSYKYVVRIELVLQTIIHHYIHKNDVEGTCETIRLDHVPVINTLDQLIIDR